MSCKSVILVQFAKPLIAGKVKTRLAISIGEAAALRVHKQLCCHVNRQLQAFIEFGGEQCSSLWLAINWQQAQGRRSSRVFWEEGMRWNYSFNQIGTNLGERMHGALMQASAHADKILLVGSDFPVLDGAYLSSALLALDSSDMILGPCEDGGYGLIGMNAGVEPCFNDVEWGKENAMAQTVNANKNRGYAVCELSCRHDVDTLEDLQRWYCGDWRPSERVV